MSKIQYLVNQWKISGHISEREKREAQTHAGNFHTLHRDLKDFCNSFYISFPSFKPCSLVIVHC